MNVDNLGKLMIAFVTYIAYCSNKWDYQRIRTYQIYILFANGAGIVSRIPAINVKDIVLINVRSHIGDQRRK